VAQGTIYFQKCNLIHYNNAFYDQEYLNVKTNKNSL